MIENLPAIKYKSDPQALRQAILFENRHLFAGKKIRSLRRRHQPRGHHQKFALARAQKSPGATDHSTFSTTAIPRSRMAPTVALRISMAGVFELAGVSGIRR